MSLSRACLICLLAMAALCQTANAAVAVKSHEQWGRLGWLTPRPSLEQLAYHYWGEPLRQACPNGSLRVLRVRPSWAGPVEDGAMGESWKDCQPWVNRAGLEWPEICASAIHETGHERGLLDERDGGGIMDQGRFIIESRGIVHHRRGRITRFTIWTGIPNVCQPGYRIPRRFGAKRP